MLKQKICLPGSFGVGKTSLAARFVTSLFSDKYHTTAGVKIDRKIVSVDDEEVTLTIRDMAGEEDGAPVILNRLRDASGYLLVIDGTCGKTLDIARGIQQRVEAEIGARPFLAPVNKVDLRESAAGWSILETRAKTGSHVEEAFLTLTSRIPAAQKASAASEDEDDDDE